MISITFTEFRKKASSLINEVEKGEIIQLIRHGRPVAEISPVKKSKSDPLWKKPGLRLTVEGGSLTEAILQERDSDKK